jgi:hypothetical protein
MVKKEIVQKRRAWSLAFKRCLQKKLCEVYKASNLNKMLVNEKKCEVFCKIFFHINYFS